MKNNIRINYHVLALFLLFPLASYSQVMFQTGQSLSTPESWFEVVAVGDINNDGLEDIVAATSYYFSEDFDYKLFVYLQSTSGTFPTTTYYSYSNHYPGLKAIDIADVNNDSLNDVIIGYADSMAIFFQNGSGTLDPWVGYSSGSGVQDVKVADINNDNLNDIVVAHSEASYIRAFYQTETGFTTSVYAKPMSGRDELEIGDVNADGLNDIVFMVGAFAGGIHVFIQNEDGNLNNYVSYFPGGMSPHSLNGIAIGDLNNDGHNDVAAAKGGNSPSASLIIWHQDTITNLLKEATTTPAYEIPSNIEIADFNCEGGPEIFMTHGGWDAITVWPPDGEGQYTEYDLYPVSVAQHPSAEGLTSGDIDHDGKLDIVAVGNLTTIQLLYNISIPTSFLQIDTTIVIDTTTNYISNDYFFTTIQSDTSGNYIITQRDSFLIAITIRQDTIQTDSTFSRNGILCDSVYTDIIVSGGELFYETVNRDTTYWSSTTDTTFISALPTLIVPGIHFFPNPFNTYLTCQVANQEQTFFSLYDLNGRQILNQSFTNSTTLNTTSLKTGVYIYKMYQGNVFIKTGKMVKQ